MSNQSKKDYSKNAGCRDAVSVLLFIFGAIVLLAFLLGVGGMLTGKD